MIHEARNPLPTMKIKPGFDQFFSRHRVGKGPREPRDRADERKEALVLLAIAILFVANVVLYLCHHYGLTSLNHSPPPAAVSARMLLD